MSTHLLAGFRRHDSDWLSLDMPLTANSGFAAAFQTFMAHEHQIPLDPDLKAGFDADGGVRVIAPDLAYRRLAIVNVVFYGLPGSREWVLIDAGLPMTAHFIKGAAEERFGEDVPPAAIVMTHGHFDHVGTLEDLVEKWGCPVYAHPLEMPFLNGTKSYPPPNTEAGNGIMPRLAPLFPRDPVDVSAVLQPLPEDGSVPFMPGWRWIHTPGHTPGHISLWREADRTIIAGDAFITTNQESAYASVAGKTEMHGPPMYFTPDWAAAGESVAKLAALEPELAVTGHGDAMQGEPMRMALHELSEHFASIAIPDHGRYVI